MILLTERVSLERVFKGKCHFLIEDEERFRIFLRIERGRVALDLHGLEIKYDIHDIIKKGDTVYQVNDCSVNRPSLFLTGKDESDFVSISFLILLRNRNEIFRYI